MDADKKKIWINGQLIEVTEEVYAAYMKGDRKIRYFEKNLKTERFLLDESGQLRQVIPSREDSLDRLMEDNAEQFADQHERVEDQVFCKISIEQLYEALQRLTDTEQSLIYALFLRSIRNARLVKFWELPSRLSINRKPGYLKS